MHSSRFVAGTIFCFQFIFLFLPCSIFAQTIDHRNRNIDSLETVLAANPPAGMDLARVYRALMWGYYNTNTEKSTEYAWKCIDLSVRFNLLWNVVTSYGTIGVNFYHISQFDSAMVYYEKALEATERMKDFPKKYDESYIDDAHGIIYGSMGNLFNIQGRYTDAIACYQKVFTICEKYGWKQKQALIYSNIGEVYAEMENYEQAEINYVKLDSIAHEINDSLFIVLAKEGLSLICMHYCDYDKALENANIANDYYFSHPEEEGIARIRMLNLLSQIYLEGYGDDRRVEEYVRQALALLVELDFPQEKAVTLRVLSSIYLKRDQWRQAEKTAIEALAIDDSQLGNTLALYEILSKACSHQGNSDKAGEYFDKFKALQS
jgi:tetratricopeptide (TPR) repeat protein